MIQNPIFQFAFIILFYPVFWFNMFFIVHRNLYHHPSSNVTSITQNSQPKSYFLNLRVFFKDLFCCGIFYNLYHFWKKIFFPSSNEKMYMWIINNHCIKIETLHFYNFKAHISQIIDNFIVYKNCDISYRKNYVRSHFVNTMVWMY